MAVVDNKFHSWIRVRPLGLAAFSAWAHDAGMCGRYAIDVNDFGSRFDVEAPPVSSFNVAPGSEVPVVLGMPRHLEQVRWGLTPAWLPPKDRARGIINVRAETLSEKRTFLALLRTGRCLVPANGFYEWRRDGKVANPFFIRDPGEEVLAFAGLCDSTGEKMRLAIVTTEANTIVAPVHARMPVILPRAQETLWLDPDAPEELLLSLLQPYPAERTLMYPVSPAVNRASAMGRELMAPLGE